MIAIGKAEGKGARTESRCEPYKHPKKGRSLNDTHDLNISKFQRSDPDLRNRRLAFFSAVQQVSHHPPPCLTLSHSIGGANTCGKCDMNVVGILGDSSIRPLGNHTAVGSALMPVFGSMNLSRFGTERIFRISIWEAGWHGENARPPPKSGGSTGPHRSSIISKCQGVVVYP